ncbi:hypothetical protein PFTANZ_01660, partial [Plasmodium falciparum Tanzania (2000708)]
STNDPCQLIEDKGDELLGAHGDPCKKDGTGKDVDRFSDKQQAEYDNKKMKCSNGDACAPFRRLHLCNKNFQNINNDDSSKAKHDLLAEVCLAAKYEGESIKTHHPQHQVTYSDSAAELCTVLARSFADIGDIVRGRDLYRGGNNKRRQQLDDKLKKIFGKIHDEVTRRKQNGQALQARYQDENGGNFFQLREDWWTANRNDVWKAITCNDDNKLSNASYFRETCNDTGQGPSQTHNKCTCNNGDVPTYFDYVPQYLRWFEEWAEDFCRKKKKN